MSVPSGVKTSTSNILSNSLLSDSEFWKNFWEDNCIGLDNTFKVNKENVATPVLVQPSITEEIYSKTNKNRLFSFSEKPNVVNEISTNSVNQCSRCSKSKQKREELYISKSKKYKHNSNILVNLCFPNSYLYKIQYHIEKYVENTIPVFTIKDISKVKQYFIFNELACRNLFQIKGIIFKNVICRATIVGIVKQGDGSKLLVDDGTASMWCTYNGHFCESVNVTNFPMIECINIPLHHVTICCNFRRGTIVQILGTLDIFRRKFLIKKLYREENIRVSRELLYLQYILSLTDTYAKWKQDIAKIYNI